MMVENSEKHINNDGAVIWFTGLPASGKTTLAGALAEKLRISGARPYVLDGDKLRKGLCSDLAFSPHDRTENIRRAGAVAAILAEAGCLVLAAFVSPYRVDREKARGMVPEGRFLEVYLDTPLSVCEQRDPKGLYWKARAGQLMEFTGVNAPYEAPDQPDIKLDTSSLDCEFCVERLFELLIKKNFLRPQTRSRMTSL